MDSLYSVALLVSLLLGAAAVLAAMVYRWRRRGNGQHRSRTVWFASIPAWLALLLSFGVHLAWGHTPGGPSALAPWPFVQDHVSFLIATALPAAALLLNHGRGER